MSWASRRDVIRRRFAAHQVAPMGSYPVGNQPFWKDGIMDREAYRRGIRALKQKIKELAAKQGEHKSLCSSDWGHLCRNSLQL